MSALLVETTCRLDQKRRRVAALLNFANISLASFRVFRVCFTQ